MTSVLDGVAPAGLLTAVVDVAMAAAPGPATEIPLVSRRRARRCSRVVDRAGLSCRGSGGAAARPAVPAAALAGAAGETARWTRRRRGRCRGWRGPGGASGPLGGGSASSGPAAGADARARAGPQRRGRPAPGPARSGRRARRRRADPHGPGAPWPPPVVPPQSVAPLTGGHHGARPRGARRCERGRLVGEPTRHPARPRWSTTSAGHRGRSDAGPAVVAGDAQLDAGRVGTRRYGRGDAAAGWPSGDAH